MSKYIFGEEDIQVTDCKYGNKCINSKCLFNHGAINGFKQKIYEIPIVKEKKRKEIKKREKSNVKITSQVIIPDVVDEKSYGEKNLVKILNKEKEKTSENTESIKPSMVDEILNYDKINLTENGELNKPSMVDEILNYEKINLLNLYKKYNNIYKLFQECNFNYNLINKKKLQLITNDKNIYKLKKRA